MTKTLRQRQLTLGYKMHFMIISIFFIIQRRKNSQNSLDGRPKKYKNNQMHKQKSNRQSIFISLYQNFFSKGEYLQYICFHILQNSIIVFRRMMKANKLSMLHKGRLNLISRQTKQNVDKPSNIELCSTGFTFSKELQRHFGNSREKQQKKLVLKQNVRKSVESSTNTLKVRSMSTKIEIPRVTSSLSHFQLLSREAKQHQLDKNCQLQHKVRQLIEEMKKKFILLQNHHSSFSIKKDHFHNVLNVFVRIVSGRVHGGDDNELASLAKTFKEIQGLIVESRRDHCKEKMHLSSRTFQQAVKRSDYLQDTQILTSQIEKLYNTKSNLAQEIGHMQKFKASISKQVYQKQQQFHNDTKKLEKCRSEICSYQKQISTLKGELDFYRKQVAQIKQISEKISSYVGNQSNKIIAMASEEYKNIESDIYQYASYLQCNQLASSLEYEPISITCLTQGLDQSLKNINRTLIQNEEMPVKQKGILMRDFVLKWMGKYKKKDQQQKQLMAFKTKCVQNFILKMKKWLDNWTLKQEYLVSLRDQFAFDTTKIHGFHKQISSQQLCPECSNSIKPILIKMLETYNKIQENYKLGNSFY